MRPDLIGLFVKVHVWTGLIAEVFCKINLHIHKYNHEVFNSFPCCISAFIYVDIVYILLFNLYSLLNQMMT